MSEIFYAAYTIVHVLLSLGVSDRKPHDAEHSVQEDGCLHRPGRAAAAVPHEGVLQGLCVCVSVRVKEREREKHTTHNTNDPTERERQREGDRRVRQRRHWPEGFPRRFKSLFCFSQYFS